MTKDLEAAFNALADAIAELVVEKLVTQLPVKQRLVDAVGAAEYTGFTVEAIRTKSARGKLKRVKIGKSIRFDLRNLDALIDESKDR